MLVSLDHRSLPHNSCRGEGGSEMRGKDYITLWDDILPLKQMNPLQMDSQPMRDLQLLVSPRMHFGCLAGRSLRGLIPVREAASHTRHLAYASLLIWGIDQRNMNNINITITSPAGITDIFS